MFAWPATLWHRELRTYHQIFRENWADWGVAFNDFSLACNENTDASDTAQLFIFFRITTAIFLSPRGNWNFLSEKDNQ